MVATTACQYWKDYVKIWQEMKKYRTRQSSRVTARGIPTTTQQVLTLLSWPGLIHHPVLARGCPEVALPTWDWGASTWDWGVSLPPQKKTHMGPVEVLWNGDRVPTPLSELTNKLKTLPSVILRIRVVIT